MAMIKPVPEKESRRVTILSSFSGDHERYRSVDQDAEAGMTTRTDEIGLGRASV